MIRIAILGDIGSGKSYVAKQFGYPVFNADVEVAKLYRKSRKCYNRLKKVLPAYIVSFPIKKRELIIIGDKKSLRIQCVTQKISLIDNNSKEIKEISIIPNNTIRDELEFFINSCKHNQTIPSPYPNAIVAKNILEIILEAEIKNSDKK